MMPNQTNTNKLELKYAFYSSLFVAVLTIVAFAFAMMAVPPAGPYCPGNCIEYPYLNSLQNYPRDYIWMYIVVFQIFAFVIFTISIHYNTDAPKRINSSVALAFAIISATVLLSDYFVQFAVVPISLMQGETDGIALLTQYNGHGIFIALEELGYIAMGLSLLFLAPSFTNKTRLEKNLKWLFSAPAILLSVAFIGYSLKFGIDRSYRFEVAIITIDWLFLIALGILASVFFKKQLKKL